MAVEELTETQVLTLEQFGIIKTPKPPKLDVLVREIAKRHGRLTLSVDGEGAVASVGLTGAAFDAVSDNPSLAIVDALTQALIAEPQQISFFEGNAKLSEQTSEALRRLKERHQAQTEQGAADGETPKEGDNDA
jgi:hypothetical protein